AKHPLPAELAIALDAIARHPAVPGVAEIDRSVRPDADVIGAVELLPLEMRGQHLAVAAGGLSDEGGGGMFADDQVQIGVISHAVAFVRRPADLADAALGVP